MSSDEFRLNMSKDGRIETKYVDHLSDEDLDVLNKLLPWKCFTLDANGRQFGAPASEEKRNVFQSVPDPRITELNRRYPLTGRNALEIGCFEGVHTIALADRGAVVTAVDSRIESVVKTIVRTWSFGFHVNAFKCDIENSQEAKLLPRVDVLHHVGVLYHLVDPVAHLNNLLPKIADFVMLDTHFAKPEIATESYESCGENYFFKRHHEGGRANAFSGMYDHAKWLTLESIVQLLKDNGFTNVDVAELRQERNGDRALLYAARE